MKLRWTQRARNDLLAIARYIAADDPAAARRWTGKLRQRARSAAAVPYAGRMVPEFRRDDIREVFLRTYRIVYRIHREPECNRCDYRFRKPPAATARGDPKEVTEEAAA